MAGARSPRATPGASSGFQTAALHVPLTMAHPNWVEKPDSAIPAQADAALTHAMTLEGVPSSWQSGLRFIMAQKSGGQVNAKNPVHSARGLFQLTAANYHLNPNGAGSFGNAWKRPRAASATSSSATAPQTMRSRSGGSTTGIERGLAPT